MEKETNRQYIIAIDGYSSCGKSTLAKDLAKTLNILFIDTGAMYRAVALYVLENQLVDEEGKFDEQALEQHLPKIEVSFDTSVSITNPTILLNGRDVSIEIRKPEVSNLVSIVAANSFVRKKMVAEQRRISNQQSVVLDGRDIGTVVFPNATLKLFLTASVDVRAQRRYNELRSKGEMDITFDEVKANLEERDRIDTTREDSPLIKSNDALEIDNTNLTIQEQKIKILDILSKIIG